jgi:hypothetical protein
MGSCQLLPLLKGRNCCTDGEEEGTVWCEWERKGKGKQTDGSDTVAHCESSGRAEPGCRWRSALERPCGGCEDVKKSRGLGRGVIGEGSRKSVNGEEGRSTTKIIATTVMSEKRNGRPRR